MKTTFTAGTESYIRKYRLDLKKRDTVKRKYA